MKAVVLSAVATNDILHRELAAKLERQLVSRGYEVRFFELATTKLAFCQGEFDCWLRTPGECKSADAERDIARAVHEAEVTVFMGPVTFGAHGYTLKRAIDRLICLVAPFFEVRRSLTHHAARYAHAPRLYALGFSPQEDREAARTFESIADANAMNLLCPAFGAAVVLDEQREAWDSAIANLLSEVREPGAAIENRDSLTRELIAACTAEQTMGAPEATRTAAWLIGSAKPKGTSSSEMLARALAARLSRAGVLSSFHFATELVREDARAESAATDMAAADLLVVASPLYVDAFPALVTHGLELIAKVRAPRHVARESRVSAIINCGFPEPEHTRSAARVLRHFAEAARYHYAGVLPLGGGGVVDGKPIADDARAAHGPIAHVARALDLAAPALARGVCLPGDAILAMMERGMPDSLYRAGGDLGFRWAAYRAGTPQRDLRKRTLDPDRSAPPRGGSNPE